MAAIFNEYQSDGLLALRSANADSPCGCGSGVINRNGGYQAWESVESGTVYYTGGMTSTSKHYYNHEEANNYLIKSKEDASTAASYGLSGLLPTLSKPLLDKLTAFAAKYLSKSASISCTLSTVLWDGTFKNQADIFNNLHNQFSDIKYDGLGLYQIKTEFTSYSPTGVSQTRTRLEFFTSDGCSFQTVIY